MGVNLVHDDEAGIVPVARILRAGIAQPGDEKRRVGMTRLLAASAGLLLGRRGGRLGAGGRRGAGSRRGASGRSSTSGGRGAFDGRGFGGGRGGGSGGGALLFDHAGRRDDGADGEVAAADDRLDAFGQGERRRCGWSR